MAEKKADVKAPEKPAEKTEEETEVQPEETIPAFEFPTDTFGVLWSTCANNMLYWVQHVDGKFTYDGTEYEDAWAVVSDDGVKEIVTNDDFNDHYVPYSTQAHLEPSYLAAEAEAAAEKKSKAEEKTKAA